MSGRWRTAALTILAVAAVAPSGGLAAQARPQRPQEPAQQRRALERRFHERFLDMSRRRLDLEERQTERLGELLQRGSQARHALQRELAAERERFQEAIGNPDTTDEEFRRRLDAMEQLRSREYELWRSEQRALAEFMTPRQRAMFVQMQMRMNDAVRDVRDRHGGRDRDGDRARDGDPPPDGGGHPDGGVVGSGGTAPGGSPAGGAGTAPGGQGSLR